MLTISASVGVGGRNRPEDTRKVQGLLNKSRVKSGSPMIKVDGITGPETNGAIRAFQKNRSGFADGRVDPSGPTLKALNEFADDDADARIHCGQRDLSGGLSKSASVERLSMAEGSAILPKDVAVTHKPEALLWIGAALAAIQTVRSLMQTGLTQNLIKLDSMLEFRALNTHFHLDAHPNPLKFPADLGKTYMLMSIAVSGAETNFEDDFTSDSFANADSGGFARRNDPLKPGRMFFCWNYVNMGPISRVVTIIHEAAHYVDAAIDHFATSVPFPNGRALTGSNGQMHSRNYVDLTPDEARQNAASYAGFAIHVAKRQDLRPNNTQ